MVLNLIDDSRWIELVQAHQALHEIGAPELVGSVAWNRAFDRWADSFRAVVADAELLGRVRDLVAVTSSSSTLRFLDEVLQPPVAEFALDVPRLLNDARVGLDPSHIAWQFALYVSESRRWARGDPYETDRPQSGLSRSLSRLGGAPTHVPGVALPDAPFLLQVDLGEQLGNSVADERAKAFVRASGLPRGGVLQLFHTTTDDSCSDRLVPGGGATVVYLTEEQLRHRTLPDLDQDCAVFPVSEAKLAVLPTFVASADAPLDDVAEKLVRLQGAVDRLARGDDLSEYAQRAFDLNPFAVPSEPPSRLLGLHHYDYPLEPWHADRLSSVLPLHEPDDSYVLLFSAASGFTFGEVFGPSGVLSVWMRRSDLLNRRFGDLFCLIRST